VHMEPPCPLGDVVNDDSLSDVTKLEKMFSRWNAEAPRGPQRDRRGRCIFVPRE
jgi:hypothetical protein